MFQCNMNDAPTIGILGIVSHRAMIAAKDLYSVFDLNRSQASILLTLHHCKSMSQKELAEQLNITAPSITSSIRKMEQAGYIVRETDPDDQRVMRLMLTKKGCSCIQSIKDVKDKMEDILLGGMSVEEKILFRRLLMHVDNNLDQYERKEKV